MALVFAFLIPLALSLSKGSLSKGESAEGRGGRENSLTLSLSKGSLSKGSLSKGSLSKGESAEGRGGRENSLALSLSKGAPALVLGLVFLASLPGAPAAAETEPAAFVTDHDRAAVLRVGRPPLGLPPVPVPAENPVSAAKVALGRKLLFDRRLSASGTVSCGMCHVPEQGFALNESRLAIGHAGRTVRRNAPTLMNTAYMESMFHDGRKPSLEAQIVPPLLAPNEMANPSLDSVVEKLESLPDYAGLFAAAFGEGPSIETMGKAIASYERTLLSANSPFDRFRYGGDEGAISGEAKAGFRLFTGKARCAFCHLVGKDRALFTDNLFHNTGVGHLAATERPKRQSVRVELAPGEYATLPMAAVMSVGEPPEEDFGRFEVTGDPADRFAYKTPSLRNVALTAPYMHDGSLSTLAEVVRFYSDGGAPNPGLSPLLLPLGLSDSEVGELVAFLESLTGDNIAALIRDARSVTVGNPGANLKVQRSSRPRR